MGETVSLTEIRLQPRTEVVEAIEELLADAKSGRIRGYAFVGSLSDHCMATGYELGDGAVADLVCAIERLKLRLLAVGGEDEP